LAALAYLAIAVGAVDLGLIQSRAVAVAAALALSFAIAYLGHHGFTYRRNARHRRYLPRFMAAQAALCALMMGVVLGLTQLGVDYRLANLIIVVVWPLVNLAAADLFVFREE
jgi:putative flippase GtrA